MKLTFSPEVDNYSVTDGNGIIYNGLEGGLGRYRRDILGVPSVVTVTWRLSKDEYTYLRAFYREAVRNASTPFTMDLIIDEDILTEHECHFIPDTMRLNEQRGYTYIVSASLQIKPLLFV
jgi:hypothetical protein